MEDPLAEGPRARDGRFEYRIFAPRLAELRARLREVAERSQDEPARRETYLLSADTRRGIKLRGERLEAKRWVESRLGCQRWRPTPGRATALSPASLVRQPVRKERTRFWLADATAEIVRLRVGDGSAARELESAAVEGDDPRAVARWVEELGLRSRANQSYPQFLRRARDASGERTMPIEIERKFRVAGEGWRERAVESTRLTQGYLLAEKGRSVRVRRAGERAWLTIKGETRGATRAEFEYPIPASEALELLRLCERTPIEKTRHRVPHAGRTFEVDEFHGDNAGLVLAEIELDDPEEEVALPDWIGEEVTGDSRYLNACLVEHPYVRWKEPAGDRVPAVVGPPDPEHLAETLIALLDQRLGRDAGGIRTQIAGGTARLAGIVPTRRASETAGELASSLAGIDRVENELRVETSEPEDVQPTPSSPPRGEPDR